MGKTTDRKLDEAILATRLRAALDARLTTGPMTFGADVAEACLAALDTLAGAGWQDISTAPKDAVVDLWSSRGFRLTDCIWDVTRYGQIDEPDVWGWTDKNHHGSVEEGGPFTHWRLPPEAPTT